MRVVFDTNIIVSGILSARGAARALLDLARLGHITLVTSPVLLDELEDVLTRFVPRAAAGEIRSAVEEIADVVGPVEVPSVTRDPDDDHVLATATAGNVAYIVSRDHDLLTLGAYQEIPILAPAPALHTVRAQLERY